MLILIVFCILIVLVAAFFPGLLSNIVQLLLAFAGFAILGFLFGWNIILWLIGIPVAIGIIIGLFVPINDKSADDLIKEIETREQGTEGNSIYKEEII